MFPYVSDTYTVQEIRRKNVTFSHTRDARVHCAGVTHITVHACVRNTCVSVLNRTIGLCLFLLIYSRLIWTPRTTHTFLLRYRVTWLWRCNYIHLQSVPGLLKNILATSSSKLLMSRFNRTMLLYVLLYLFQGITVSNRDLYLEIIP